MTRPRPVRRPRPTISRRLFLEGVLGVGAIAAGGSILSGCSPDRAVGPAGSTRPRLEAERTDGGDPAGRLVSGAIGDRLLVVIDLEGGNDGLSTLVPYDDARYYDLRPDLAIAPEELLAIDSAVGLHPSLERLHGRGLTTVEGVGPLDGDLSHFDMAARWQRGDVSGIDATARTGFLGRLADAVDDGAPLVGVSMAGPSPYLTNLRAATMSLASPDELWIVQPTDWDEMALYQRQLGRLGGPELIGRASASYGQLLDLGAKLDGADDDVDWDHPMLADGGDLGWQLYIAADLLAADVGTRIVYAATGDYDTHSDHRYRQSDNLAQLDAAVDGFLRRAEQLGFADRVVVATVSEFGRRVPENDSGLDHGAASTMLLTGAVEPMQAGDRPGLDDLDDDDNLRTTIGFDRYLASLAEEWLGVEAASVLPGEPSPLGLF